MERVLWIVQVRAAATASLLLLRIVLVRLLLFLPPQHAGLHTHAHASKTIYHAKCAPHALMAHNTG